MGEQKFAKDHLAEKQWTIYEETKSYGFGIRHMQMACMFMSMTTLFVVRGSMGVAVLAMSDKSRLNDTDIKIYDWDKKTQGVILSSFFWGYMVMQIPGSILGKRFGGKPMIFIALLSNGILCLLLPTLAQVGDWWLVCVARMAMGLTQACLYSNCQTLFGRWLPAHERTTWSGIVFSGNQTGTIIAMAISGWLASSTMGWKLIFYVMAALMFLTTAVWYFFAASSPAQHRLISAAEREYIEMSPNAAAKSQGTRRTPWRHILLSRPVWAVLATHIGCSVAFTLFFVDMPTYLEKGLGTSLRDSALLSALPYIASLVSGVIFSTVCEIIYNKRILSVLACRKIFNSLAMYGMGVSLIVLSYLGPDQKMLAVVMLIITLSLYSAVNAGFMANHLDLSPNFAGITLSLTNFISNCCIVGMPPLTSIILRNDPTDVSRWRVVFLGVAVICIVTNTFYLWLSSGDRQPWDDPHFGRRSHSEETKPALNKEKEREANETSLKQ